MDENKTTFEIIMENCPFLKSLIQDKIAEEVGKKDVEILALQETNAELITRVIATEKATSEASTTQQELIDLLVEGAVI